MGIEDYLDGHGEDSDGDSDSDASGTSYEDIASLHTDLDPEIAAIVDKVIEEWKNDTRVDITATPDYVRADRCELVYGITNIVMRTQKVLEDKE